MNIFTDLHHFDLYYSLQLLCKRFGWNLYRPIGLDWKFEDYWAINNDPEFIAAMLSTESGKTKEILSKYETLANKDWAVFSLHLPRIGPIINVGDGLFYVIDISKNVIQDSITLERFKQMKFDVIISSLPQHFDRYERLRNLYQPQAKHIFHMAGIGWSIPSNVRNLMLNSKMPTNINHVVYKQEFDTQVFAPQLPKNTTSIRSYVHFPQTEELWNKLDLKEYDFSFVSKTLGKLSDIVIRTEDLAQSIVNSTAVLHIKPGGESYGHVLHNSYAIGRPVMTDKRDFIGTAGEELLTDDTSIDISKYSINELRSKIIELSQLDNLLAIHEKIVNRFKSIVDFDNEANKVKQFMENLI